MRSEILIADGFEARLDCYVGGSAERRPAVLIMPGGGYGRVSPREGKPIAEEFLRLGYNAFVLNYSTAGTRHPVQLHQGFAALEYIVANATAHNTDVENINVCGFSAGGHLAANVAIMNNATKINRMILCYPVISSGEYAPKSSFNNLVGDNEEQRNYLSLEHRVTPQTPPAFIWHTSNDEVVDVRNSLLFASALRANRVLFEMHIYPKGLHGLSLATEKTMAGNPQLVQPDCADWIYLADKFIKKDC